MTPHEAARIGAARGELSALAWVLHRSALPGFAMDVVLGRKKLVEAELVRLEGEAGHLDFQASVFAWLEACFPPPRFHTIAHNHQERNERFLEEALELVQAFEMTREAAHALVDHVFSRAAGEPGQEAGGVMVTLACLCANAGLDMEREGSLELQRIWTKIGALREKQAHRPKLQRAPEGGAK